MNVIGRYIIFLLLLVSCTAPTVPVENTKTSKLFKDISSAASGFTFVNKIVETEEVNYYKYVYLYNGGGVGIGDINNDNLPDIYMTSTQGVDQLFLNKGNLTFEDISNTAGINKYQGQKTGVTMVDINNDGWLDIYVCRAGWLTDENSRRNLLFINNKDNTFQESAGAFGLDDMGHSTQAAFFDYDKDGDLDVYVANHPGEFQQPLTEMVQKTENPVQSMSDKLYQNNGNSTFSDVSTKAGISNYGYALGLAIGDLNNDGWQDVYVSNDFATHDYYYINNGDGTFKESLKEYFPHCSYFAMGNDIVDLNNDGYLDLFTVEMLSEDNMRQKTMMAPMDLGRFSYLVNNNLHYQYMRNSLQINNGNGYFSDIAYYSGLDKTDWSWGTLFGDYDNDGDNDLVVVNGFLTDTQDKDFSKRSNELAKKSNDRLTFEQAHALLKSTPTKNYAFEYEGDYKFKKVSDEWGFNFSGFSNGVAYGDLDRDGDLDIVVNNINNDASLYENTKNSDDYIAFTLVGAPENISGLHTQLTLYTSGGKQFKDFQVTRGFQSSCDFIIHFGLKPNTTLDSLLVEWPDGKIQTLTNLKKGAYQTLTYDSSLKNKKEDSNNKKDKLFKEVTGSGTIDFKHKEIYHNDYDREVLLPHLLSQLGPALAVGDVDNNGLEDFYIGGAHQQSAALYIQQKAGQFSKTSVKTWAKDADFEDTDALFIDADKDGDVDLYVVSGSNEFDKNSPLLKDRFYLNDGKGNFLRDETAIPEITSSGGSITKIDFDSDGDEDLFVGGRIVPGNYPIPAPAYLLENTGGKFKDVTTLKAADLQNPGLITSSVATDFDGDGDQDLIAVGEWTDIQFYKNNKGQLELVKDKMGLNNHVGWWNSIKAADLDGDGDEDYVLGNLGLNYKYQATDEQPFQVYSADLDNNGKRDIVVGYYASDDKLYPVRGLQCSSEQMPDLKKKFPTYEAYGKADVFEVYGDALEGALNYRANDFSSIILWNNGDGSFTSTPLPVETQFAPIQDFIIMDVNNDNLPDIIEAGNWFVAEIETPRADNGTGLVLINKGGKTFEVQSVVDAGFFANKDVRNLGLVSCGKDHPALLLVANNNNQLQVFEIEKNAKIQ
jgi:hypothetical protein